MKTAPVSCILYQIDCQCECDPDEKLLCALLAALTLLGCACADMDAFYRETALELAAEVDELALSGLLTTFYGASQSMATLAEGYGRAACHEPDAVRALELDLTGMLRSLLGQTRPSLLESLTPAQRGILSRLLQPGGVVSVFAGQAGSEAMAASSICRAARSHLEPEGWPGEAVVLLEKEGAEACIAAAYGRTGEGIVTATAQYPPWSGSAEEALSQMEGLLGARARELAKQ